MKTIINNKETIYVKEKSKFIGIIKKVSSKDEIASLLNYFRNLHPSATHICYAYILPHTKKCSDDGEPQGTAGLPLLDLLEKNNLCYVIAIVIRYFGGIKLGTNGLIRAYTATIKDTLVNNIKELEEAYLVKFEENYHQNNNLDYLLQNEIIVNKEYADKIIIYAIIRKKNLNIFSSFNYQIIEEKII